MSEPGSGAGAACSPESKAALVDARGLFVALIDRIAHHQLQLAFAGSERELFCLLGSNQKSDSLDAVCFALVFGLVDVLTVGQDLDVLQDDLGNRILRLLRVVPE